MKPTDARNSDITDRQAQADAVLIIEYAMTTAAVMTELVKSICERLSRGDPLASDEIDHHLRYARETEIRVADALLAIEAMKGDVGLAVRMQ